MHPRLQSAEASAIRFLDRNRVRFLQVSLVLVFLWFGGLKLVGASPVEGLVALTVPWLPTGSLIIAVGLWEVAIGILFLTGRFIRLTLALFLLQMAGTFLLLILEPRLAFQGENPLLLTTVGEFVVKNLVLVAAGLSVGGHLLRDRCLGGDGEGSGKDPDERSNRGSASSL